MSIQKDIYNIVSQTPLGTSSQRDNVSVTKSRWNTDKVSLKLVIGESSFNTQLSYENAVELAHGLLAVVHGECKPEEKTETTAD